MQVLIESLQGALTEKSGKYATFRIPQHSGEKELAWPGSKNPATREEVAEMAARELTQVASEYDRKQAFLLSMDRTYIVVVKNDRKIVREMEFYARTWPKWLKVTKQYTDDPNPHRSGGKRGRILPVARGGSRKTRFAMGTGELDEGRKETFKAATKRIMDYLEKEGWTVKRRLKIPWAEDCVWERGVKLWFKAQAVWAGPCGTGANLGTAHSTHVDIRGVDAAKFVAYVQRKFEANEPFVQSLGDSLGEGNLWPDVRTLRMPDERFFKRFAGVFPAVKAVFGYLKRKGESTLFDAEMISLAITDRKYAGKHVRRAAPPYKALIRILEKMVADGDLRSPRTHVYEPGPRLRASRSRRTRA